IVDLDPNVPAKMNGDIKKLHKIFRHLLENAVKFTKRGGIYVRMYTEKVDPGMNLCIEMTDTGIGMDRKALASVADGLFQVNKKRNRSSGGIGLGLYIVYGFAHSMGGFVKIESEKGTGTTIRITLPQKVVDPTPCLVLSKTLPGALLFHVRSDKYKVPQLRDFYRQMAVHLADGVREQLFSAETVYDVERIKEKTEISYIFMGQEEYEDNRGYFDATCQEGIVVVVSANPGFKANPGSRVLVMPKPLYAYPVIKVLNEGLNAGELNLDQDYSSKPVFDNVRALIVDDEPMNLVVASGIFKDYGMVIDTAGSGREAITKFRENDYEVIFMDHMMPEMDGVEAMKQIRGVADDMGRSVVIVALTANVVSGAREMFIREGFDGFIAKPINTADFERVMLRALHGSQTSSEGNRR
ncbi:MAG: response regulator, partial [Butyrivibrio sp.]|nr:response regulator [Butyrivibrio sp.]